MATHPQQVRAQFKEEPVANNVSCTTFFQPCVFYGEVLLAEWLSAFPAHYTISPKSGWPNLLEWWRLDPFAG